MSSNLASCRQNISTDEKRIRAFLSTKELPAKTGGPLEGLAVAVKDNILIKGELATAGSKILANHRAVYDATVISRLKKAGATIIGKTNLDEFAMGSSTENSAYQTTKNPWDTSKVPGGSSGGSAAAVVAGFCDVALGSDTGGSIRQPASFCGVTGLKPTYGAVSRYGLIALASSLDQIGPLAKDVVTAEKVFSVISGQDSFDQTSVKYNYQPQSVSLEKLRIGLPKELWDLPEDEEFKEIKGLVKEFVAFWQRKGAQVKKVSLPQLKLALPAYYVIMPAEASANLARYDGIRYRSAIVKEGQSLLERYLESRALFGPEVKRRIMIGTFVLSVGHYDEYYQTARRVVSLIRQDYQNCFSHVDVLIDPTSPTLPFNIGSRVDDPLKMYQADLLTVGVNLAGLPGLVVPCGFSRSGLPVGAQLVAPWFREDWLFDLGKKYQAETAWHQQRPRDTNG